MRKMFRIAGMGAILCLAVPAVWAATPKKEPNAIVIVFKDGRRESFNLSEIERVEFSGVPAPPANADAKSAVPPRGHFLGKWECGDGNGRTFYITLQDSGDAMRSIGSVHGKWVYVDGEARITWDDGAEDAIRKVTGHYQKFAYSAGKSFTDTPANVADAHNTTPHPI